MDSRARVRGTFLPFPRPNLRVDRLTFIKEIPYEPLHARVRVVRVFRRATRFVCPTEIANDGAEQDLGGHRLSRVRTRHAECRDSARQRADGSGRHTAA